jgi:hypothetical protein
MSPMSPESTVVRNYLDWLLSISSRIARGTSTRVLQEHRVGRLINPDGCVSCGLIHGLRGSRHSRLVSVPRHVFGAQLVAEPDRLILCAPQW